MGNAQLALSPEGFQKEYEDVESLLNGLKKDQTEEVTACRERLIVRRARCRCLSKIPEWKDLSIVEVGKFAHITIRKNAQETSEVLYSGVVWILPLTPENCSLNEGIISSVGLVGRAILGKGPGVHPLYSTQNGAEETVVHLEEIFECLNLKIK